MLGVAHAKWISAAQAAALSVVVGCASQPGPPRSTVPNGSERDEGDGMVATIGTVELNGENEARCSVKQRPSGEIELDISIVSECATVPGIDVIVRTALKKHAFLVPRALEAQCRDDLIARIFARQWCDPKITTPAFELPPAKSVIRADVSARCVGSNKRIWSTTRCRLPS